MWKIENHWWKTPALIAMATGMLACSESDGIEVEGVWTTQFETVEEINEEQWSFMILVDFDNDARRAITRNPDDDGFSPGTYNVLDWTPLRDDEFHYCVAGFGMESEEEARAAEVEADATDLEEGCGGFSWTHMVRQ